MSIAKDLYLPFLKKEKVANNTYTFYFDSSKQNLTFLPGQYMRVILDIENPDNRGNSRFFTISSSPLDKKYITITTRIIQSSFKKRLADLRAGEKVKFFGPMGKFYFDENTKNNRVFLAGGIGLTPFHSMIKYAHSKKLSIQMTLIVSFSKANDMVFYDELSGIAKINSMIKVVYTITHPTEEWKGERGRISASMIGKYVPNFLEPRYLIVGPPAIVSALEEVF